MAMWPTLHVESSGQLGAFKEALHALGHDIFQTSIVFWFVFLLSFQNSLEVRQNLGFQEGEGIFRVTCRVERPKQLFLWQDHLIAGSLKNRNNTLYLVGIQKIL